MNYEKCTYLAEQGTLLYLTVPGAAQCPIKVLPEKISPLAFDFAWFQILNAFATLIYMGFPAPEL